MKTLLMIGLLTPVAMAAAAGEYVVNPGGDNKVVFVSKASIESFEGKTREVEGRLNVDPASVGDTMSVHFEVDLTSLDTGIRMRNQHMREKHLETDKYPVATFDGAAVVGPVGARLDAGKPVAFDVEGTFSLHGVSRRLRINVEATYRENRVMFDAAFPVSLADYNISRPQFLFLKLAETQEVRVHGVAVAVQ